MNSFGTLFRLTTFGESHGQAMGGIIDGCPAGLKIDTAAVQTELDRRRPGASRLTTQRREADRIEFLSGLSPEGVTLGTPIGFIVRNTDQRSDDYDNLRDLYRPNHADYTYRAKYGLRDHRGGGRASARETLCRVAGGAVARQLLTCLGVSIRASLVSAGSLLNPDETRLESFIDSLRRNNDSAGGVVKCDIVGLPVGLGEPVGDKFHARLGEAMLSINAAMGFEYGEGFRAASMKGSEMVDEFVMREGKVSTATNHCGGVNGGITNGATVTFKVAFKPTPTISRPLHTLTVNGGETIVEAKGRHDPCVAIRAVPVVEAMAALTVADLLVMRYGSSLLLSDTGINIKQASDV